MRHNVLLKLVLVCAAACGWRIIVGEHGQWHGLMKRMPLILVRVGPAQAAEHDFDGVLKRWLTARTAFKAAGAKHRPKSFLQGKSCAVKACCQRPGVLVHAQEAMCPQPTAPT